MKEAAYKRRGIGVSAGSDPGIARAFAEESEGLGYHSLWSNDEPRTPGLETLAHFAAATKRVDLGVGVMPFDRHSPGSIAARIDSLGLDPERLWIGVGLGQSRSMDVVRRGVAELRELLPEQTRIVIAAMRRRLCRLGGEIADGVLLNWILPAQAEEARRWIEAGAQSAGRPVPVVASYIRVAVGSGSRQRLLDAERFYRTINDGHRLHFEGMGAPLGSVGIAGSDRNEVVAQLDPFHDPLDLPIVRVLAEPKQETMTAVARAAAPGG